tara:strand:- start:6119 stop:7594 length:1476 start_codon:yes stop_codon:yes gene_type:complete
MSDLVLLLPQLCILSAALLVLIYNTIFRKSTKLTILTLIAVVGSFCSIASAIFLFISQSPTVTIFGDQLVVDGSSLFFSVIISSVTLLVSIASYNYIKPLQNQAEYYSLLLLAAAGMGLMASANSLVIAFVAMELASLPSYALVTYLKNNEGSTESGLKYFLIGALSSAIFVYGSSLIYGATGSLGFTAISESILNTPSLSGLLGIGILMVIGGLAFKTTSVPFHFWAPDAYEGAISPVSAFISSASKAAGFILAFRILIEAFPLDVVSSIGLDWALAIQILAVLTMTLGNFAAALQENVKRMLAYSSIGHAGYVLIGLAALSGSQDTLVIGASMMHLMIYGFMNTGAFLFIALAEHWNVGPTFKDYRGLGSKAPLVSIAMTVFLFSLAGLPTGGGFLTKYVLFMAAVGAGFWWLAAIGAINSALSLYFYTRLVKSLWVDPPISDLNISSKGIPVGIYVAILIAAVVTILSLPFFSPFADFAMAAANILIS